MQWYLRKIVVHVMAYGTLGYRYAMTCVNIPPRPLDEKIMSKPSQICEPMIFFCICRCPAIVSLCIIVMKSGVGEVGDVGMDETVGDVGRH